MAIPIHGILQAQDVPTSFHVVVRPAMFLRGEEQPERMSREFDMIIDFFTCVSEGATTEPYDLVMEAMEQGMGAYEHNLSVAKRELINPLHWVADLIRLPVTLLEEADIIHTKEHYNKIIEAYRILLCGVMVILLALLTLKLGLQISDVVKAIPK